MNKSELKVFECYEVGGTDYQWVRHAKDWSNHFEVFFCSRPLKKAVS